VWTPHVENSLNPVWNADLQIPSQGSPATDQLKIEVYDKDKRIDLAKNDHIGLAETFWIHQVPRRPPRPKIFDLPLIKTDKKGKVKGSVGEAGTIKLSFELVPVEGGAPFPETVYSALIEFQSASDLPAADLDGKSDPYFEAKLAHSENSQKFKSKVIKNTLSPEWRQQATFIFGRLDKDTVEVVVSDKDEVGSDDKLAKVNIPLKDFRVGEDFATKTYELAPAEKKWKSGGKIVVLVKLSIVPSPDEPEAKPAPKQAPAEVKTRSITLQDGEECHFSWGAYGSEYSTNFSNYKEYGKGISSDEIDADELHNHPPTRLVKVAKP
jgi:hypothetical protein